MNATSVSWPVSLVSAFALALLFGCGGSSSPTPLPAPLSAGNLNLIFVASEDLAYNAPGDISTSTANLTDQGLQRTLDMGTFLKQTVLGGSNVTGIYALEPMTHLQTTNDYPDMVALETLQQFAMLNQISLSYEGSEPITAYSYPILTSYAPGLVPLGVATPALPCAACQGLDFNDQDGDNEALVTGIVQADLPGFYVFSAQDARLQPRPVLLANPRQLQFLLLRQLCSSFHSHVYSGIVFFFAGCFLLRSFFVARSKSLSKL